MNHNGALNMIKAFLRVTFTLAAAVAAIPALAADSGGSDASAVRDAMMSQFDKPDAPLQVEPVVISGGAAVAGWTQGERGGRALLFRQGGQWQIALCAGDALKDAKVMREAGVKPAEADFIAQALATTEARLTPAQRARLSNFDGMVRMNDSGHPATGHRH